VKQIEARYIIEGEYLNVRAFVMLVIDYQAMKAQIRPYPARQESFVFTNGNPHSWAAVAKAIDNASQAADRLLDEAKSQKSADKSR
jgi:hypothetical protein